MKCGNVVEIVSVVCLLGIPSAGCSASGDNVASNATPPPKANATQLDAGIDVGAPGSAANCKPGETRTCYEGPEGTLGQGICHAGIQSCILSGEFSAWGPCQGAVTPDDTPNGTCSCDDIGDADAGRLPDTSEKLCGGLHSQCECIAAGGEVVDIAQSCKICRFNSSTCSQGWTGYENWRTTIDGPNCGGVEMLSPTGIGGAAEDCPALVPVVVASSGFYMLSCDRQSSYCCGQPPAQATLATYGQPWSSHEPDTQTFSQGYNPCGCACGPEHCTTALASCVAPTTQIGCT